MRQLILLLMLIITSAVFAYEPLISEDKVWEYYEYHSYPDASCYIELNKFQFDGTQMHDAKEYHVLKRVSHSHCSWHYDFRENPDGEIIYHDNSVENEPRADIWGLLREEAGKVYIYMDSSTAIAYLLDENGNVNCDNLRESGEYLLYDFTVNESDSYLSIVENTSCDANFVETALLLLEKEQCLPYKSVSTRNCLKAKIIEEMYSGFCSNCYDEENRLCFTTIEMEGIGNISQGDLVNRGYESCVYIPNGQTHFDGFNNLYDLDGNVIYPGAGIKNPLAGIKDITTEIASHDRKMYDLNGREIRNPLPGTVYIRDGRKAVAR